MRRKNVGCPVCAVFRGTHEQEMCGLRSRENFCERKKQLLGSDQSRCCQIELSGCELHRFLVKERSSMAELLFLVFSRALVFPSFQVARQCLPGASSPIAAA